MATTKARAVPIIPITTTRHNIWLWQPLLATQLLTAEYHQVEHRASMERKGDDVDICFLPVVSDTIWVQLEQVEVTSTDIYPPNSPDKPTFGPRPDTHVTDFDFEAEVQHLPFKLNFEDETNMTCIQQSWFIDIIADHPEVFFLHDEDL